VPAFIYKGVTTSGKNTKGSITAENLRAARARMRSDGVFVTDISETAEGASARATEPTSGRKWTSIDLSGLNRIPAMERATATRQLATLVGAGIPLVDSLGAIVQQIEHARLKTVMNQVRERVNEGSSLAEAMAQSGQFDNLYVSMIRAGEESGALDVVLGRVSDYLEDSIRLRNKVSGILIYPLVMLLFAMGVVAALVTVVLPQITNLLQSLDAPLPFYTVWIIEGSEFARNWWWAMLLAAILLFSLFRVVINTERGRAVWDSFRLRMPVLGRVIRVLAIARFTRTLSTLLSSGVGIVRALDISQHVANNTVIAEAIRTARVSIIEGATLAQPLRASGQFPPLVTTMVEVGEQSGELDSMLAKVATTYDEQVENTISRLTALLEPILILIMVGIVLVIILATLMPMLEITSSLS
jgi:general secretion pathway protein F